METTDLTCFLCNEELQEPLECDYCEMNMCAKCIFTCDKCKKIYCNNHEIICFTCEEKRCLACGCHQCVSCKKDFCEKCIAGKYSLFCKSCY